MHPKLRTLGFSFALGLLVLAPGAFAQGDGVTLDVTITNLTPGQIFSAPVVVSHDRTFSLFAVGDPASEELAMLAEDAITDPLVALLEADPGVFAVSVGSGNIAPGESLTVQLQANGDNRWISVAGMLVTTNDAFYSVQGLRVQPQGVSVDAPAYDAGSEANNEDCEFIPGPPCNVAGARTATSEGFVHIHNGVHGIAELDPLLFDWRNPVARISVSLAAGGE